MKNYKIPLLLFSAALLVRLFYYFLNDNIINNDPYIYLKFGIHLASGNFHNGFDSYWSPLYPVLIALLSLICGSPWLSVLIISFAAGAAAAPATYYLIKQSYGKREALIAAAIVVFYPHLTNSTGGLWAENIYLLFIVFALIAAWNGLTKNSAKNFFLTGLLLALAYLTRPEAFGYLLFFVPLGLINGQRREKIFTRNSVKNASILLLGFFLIASPYIFYLRAANGYWTISGKFSKHIIGSTFAAGREKEFHLVNNPGELSPPPEDEQNGNDAEKQNQSGAAAKKAFKSVFLSVYYLHKDLPYLLPPFLFIFIGLGLFRRRWTLDRLKREIYLLAFCAATALGYIVTIIEVRYFYVLLPIAVGWTARGIVEIVDWLRETLADSPLNRDVGFQKSRALIALLVLLVFIYTFPLNIFTRPTDKAWEISSFEEKRAGLWLKQNSAPHPVVMAVDYRTAFYADGEAIIMSDKEDLREVLNEAAENRVDFLVVTQRTKNFMPPQLRGLLNEPQNYPQFEKVYQAEDYKNYKIVIYRIKKENAP